MENKVLYAVFDDGGQGMRNNGLLGVFTTKEKAEKAIGNGWYSIVEFETNKIYGDGIQYTNPFNIKAGYTGGNVIIQDDDKKQ